MKRTSGNQKKKINKIKNISKCIFSDYNTNNYKLTDKEIHQEFLYYKKMNINLFVYQRKKENKSKKTYK